MPCLCWYYLETSANVQQADLSTWMMLQRLLPVCALDLICRCLFVDVQNLVGFYGGWRVAQLVVCGHFQPEAVMLIVSAGRRSIRSIRARDAPLPHSGRPISLIQHIRLAQALCSDQARSILIFMTGINDYFRIVKIHGPHSNRSRARPSDPRPLGLVFTGPDFTP